MSNHYQRYRSVVWGIVLILLIIYLILQAAPEVGLRLERYKTKYFDECSKKGFSQYECESMYWNG